tara:strand:- start:408 stop:599 length:192 start_codon:yes stop_codon:yes gene_type:complete
MVVLAIIDYSAERYFDIDDYEDVEIVAKSRGFDNTFLHGYKTEFARPDVIIEESIKADSILCY